MAIAYFVIHHLNSEPASHNTRKPILLSAQKDVPDTSVGIAKTVPMDGRIDSVPIDRVEHEDTNHEARATEKKVIQMSVKSASNTRRPTKKAVIEFDALIYDHGELYEGDSFEHKFYFRNTGSAPLEIYSTSATCGCTQPSFPFVPIEPNGTGFIGVKYISTGKRGPQTSEIRVISNAITERSVLKLRCEVLMVEPKDDSTQVVH